MLTGNSKYVYLLGWVRELKPGEAHVAFRGEHYTCQSESFRGVVYQVAKEKGLAATVSVFTSCVVFAFYQPTGYLRPNLPAYPIVKKMRRQS
jgi:hypothetical protein